MTTQWHGAALFLVLFVASIIIRIPYDRLSKITVVAESRKSLLEKVLLALMAIGSLLLPILSLTSILKFASYDPSPLQIPVGLIFMFTYLWLFHRSHADLGRNWSASLEIRKDHEIVDQGVYKKIRHPMYAAIYLMAIGQALLISNWVAGPAAFIAFSLMFFFRIKPEEQMMIDRFGAQYLAYSSRTKRLIPRVW